MNDTPRINWLAALVWTALFAGLCVITNGIAWLAEQAWRHYGQWVIDHADAIAGAVLTVCVVALVVMAVAERAKKDNPSW